MSGRWLVYGATGYTGGLIAREAAARGFPPVLAGRDAARLDRLAARLGCEHRIARLDDRAQLDAALREAAVVLNTAGPFSLTARPLVEACLRAGCHYLDVAGDITVFAQLHARDAEARHRGVMVMPGVGFTVAASDCLAVHAASRLPGAQSLAIGISRPPLWSRGSMQTLMALWSDRVEVRRGGAMQAVPIGQLSRPFDYGWGERPSSAMRWPDVFTAFLSTGIPDVEAYGEVDSADRLLLETTRRFGRLADFPPWRRLLELPWQLLPDGPSESAMEGVQRVIVAEVRDRAGRRAQSRLCTPESYGFTRVTALAVVERVLRGDLAPGFQTPGGAYGERLVTGAAGVVLEDLPVA